MVHNKLLERLQKTKENYTKLQKYYRNNSFTVEIKVAGNKYNTIYVINGFINLSLTRMKS